MTCLLLVGLGGAVVMNFYLMKVRLVLCKAIGTIASAILPILLGAAFRLRITSSVIYHWNLRYLNLYVLFIKGLFSTHGSKVDMKTVVPIPTLYLRG